MTLTGQHPADESLLHPYEDFPKEIKGETLWKAEEYRDAPDKWTHKFSESEIQELGEAADKFIATCRPLTDIAKDLFPLPTLSSYFAKIRDTLLNGRGFILFKGIPVEEWSNLKCAVAYLGLGTYFGHYVAQNGKGHILGHVQNLSETPNSKDPIRIYRTNKRQFFHTDGSDIVGLLCMARAQSGGESDIASTQHIFNTIQKEDPEVIKTFITPNWWFDRKGELSDGQEPYYRSAVLFMENDPKKRVWARFDPMNVTTLERYNSGPDAKIPPLSPAQLHALNVLETTAKRLSLHMILDPGDIQLLANTHVFHARTEYTDWPHGAVDEHGLQRKQRQLMRLWLATPESEGGWKLVFPDSKEAKRGGIQVNDTPPTCPLHAE